MDNLNSGQTARIGGLFRVIFEFSKQNFLMCVLIYYFSHCFIEMSSLFFFFQKKVGKFAYLRLSTRMPFCYMRKATDPYAVRQCPDDLFIHCQNLKINTLNWGTILEINLNTLMDTEDLDQPKQPI